MSCLNTRLKAKTLYESVLVVEFAEGLKGFDQFRDRFEVAKPKPLFVQSFEEAFNTVVGFRFAHKVRRRFDAQEADLVLEVVAHELPSVIMAELETVSVTGLGHCNVN